MNTRVRTRNAVIRRLQASGRQLAGFGVRRLGLFGSFARDEQTAASDVDILVEFAPEKHTFDNFMSVAFFLEDLLGRRVEVVTPESLSPHLGPQILAEAENVPLSA